MKKQFSLIAPLLASIAWSAPAVAFEQGDWVVRLGPTYVSPNDDSNSLSGIPNTGVGVDGAWAAGFTVGRMLTDNVGVHLLGYLPPTSHDLNGEGAIGGLGQIGEVDVFPPTVSVNYHFDVAPKVKPFVGIGVNYTKFSNEEASSSLNNALGATNIDIDDSWGFAGHVGVDIDVTEKVFLSAVLWYVDIEADATLTSPGGVVNTVDVDIDPFVFMLGGGMRF